MTRPGAPEAALDPLLTGHCKGYPTTAAPRRASELAEAGWNVLAGDLPLPLAVIKRTALEHNLAWMQRQVRQWGIDLAPHGKTTMSPQLFRRQLDAGAWGLTFATVTQLAVGVAAGVRRAVLANQVFDDGDLAGLQSLLQAHEGLRVVFLVDSLAQLALIEAWAAARPGSRRFEVMLEIGVDGGRTGCRTHAQALALAAALHASPAVSLVGIECYEGLGAQGRSEADAPYAHALMDRVDAIAGHCDQAGLFEAPEVLVSAGGSAIFDLVAGRLKPALARPVRGLLRSGCYVTHDHGFYKRMVDAVNRRCGCADGLRPALEVWAAVQSRPEPGLAILAAGRRDVSFDIEMPIPWGRAARGARRPQAAPASWRVTALNDQHAYLRWDAADEAAAPAVGERVGLGISHPCTTFDKWHWMPIVEDDYRVTGAVTMHF
ncbi:alanine racemase [Aquincola sp. MAHUQ-54]|uniref:Alanine racemase n=1 Tax=Aquincola agrisoli TaxID=3119538 RepID=A0AAW9QN95_9BURK